jgi:hypothetical protein
VRGADRALRTSARATALGLGIAVLQLGVLGCGGGEADPSSSPPVDEPVAEEPTRAPAPPSEEPEAAPIPDAPETPTPDLPTPPAPPDATPPDTTPPSPEASPPAPAPPEPASLSLDELGDRIKETRAIGVFTKLALKNDIDDLLAELASYHERGEGQLATLQQRYEALVLKLLALLQDDEPELALALARSREEIWSRLVDPERFAELNS